MRYPIEHASDIGGVIRAARKIQNLRQDDAAGSVGVSESFMVKAERGADTVQWGKLFQILQGLGVRVVFDIPDVSDELLQRQSARANHRASVRERRAAERLLLRVDAAHTQDENDDHPRAMPLADERVLKAARLLVADAEASGSAAIARPAGTEHPPHRPDAPTAARALEIAHRILIDAEAARAASRDGTETPHD
ncbi:transcriptional regulator [Burkholderia sp. Bp8963]|nr:transcriptional regulator [Burkholderia sp. Bp8963]